MHKSEVQRSIVHLSTCRVQGLGCHASSTFEYVYAATSRSTSVGVRTPIAVPPASTMYILHHMDGRYGRIMCRGMRRVVRLVRATEAVTERRDKG